MANLKNKSINLYDQFTQKTQRSIKNQKMVLIAAPAVLVVLVLASVYGRIAIETMSVKSDNEEITQSLAQLEKEREEAIEQGNINVSLTKDVESLSFAYNDAMRFAQKNSYLKAKLFSDIRECGGKSVSISGCSFSDGTLNLDLVTRQNEPFDISDFVRKLRELSYFSNVTYTGYTGSDGYSFSVVCVFS